ncbi:aldehyde dehydrogenase domain-containing protein [Amylostereum chailletii]|nr:aldehyde dehydrogenase domain-containing protein [Amylostereum chailletii]
MTTFSYEFDTPVFNKRVSLPTGVFIDNEFSRGADQTTIDIVNPTTGKTVTSISEGTAADVDRAVVAARRAFSTTWGLNTPGVQRGQLLHKFADLIAANVEELGAIIALENGKTFTSAKLEPMWAPAFIRYYAGWADKNHGKTIETSEAKLAYTRHEPIGVCGQIIPWNYPLMNMIMKLGPALATGCTVVVKPSELTPLTALRVCQLIVEAGFPPGVVNVVVGYGHTVGQAITEHMDIDKIAFTGSTLTGRKVQEASAKSNLKNVTLELGGKSPSIIFDDADVEQAVKWTLLSMFSNQGQVCVASSRIFVQAGIYDKFLEAYTQGVLEIKLGDPFAPDTVQGPQVSKAQFDRIMGYIESGKAQGATAHIGGEQHGDAGYWIKPTIFTGTTPDMKIVREEIFGPVVALIKFEDEDDVVRQANDTIYGLAASVFTQNLRRAIETAHRLQAGQVYVNSANNADPNMPFGGYKQSGIGRELGEEALVAYTNVKAVHVNLAHAI